MKRLLAVVILVVFSSSIAFAQSSPRRTFLSTFVSGDITVATTVIAVDVSDTTSFPHTGGDEVRVHNIIVSASATSGWTMSCGFVTAASASGGSADLAVRAHLPSGNSQFTIPLDPTLRLRNATIGSDPSEGIVGQDYLGTLGTLDDAAGNTLKAAGAGDVILWFTEETSGRLNAMVSLEYSVH